MDEWSQTKVSERFAGQSEASSFLSTDNILFNNYNNKDMVEPNVAANSNQEQFDLAQSLEVGNTVEFDTSGGVISGEVTDIVGEGPKKIHIKGSEGKQYTLVPDGVEENEENAALWSTPKEYPGPKEMLINMSMRGEADLISYDAVQVIE